MNINHFIKPQAYLKLRILKSCFSTHHVLKNGEAYQLFDLTKHFCVLFYPLNIASAWQYILFHSTEMSVFMDMNDAKTLWGAIECWTSIVSHDQIYFYCLQRLMKSFREFFLKSVQEKQRIVNMYACVPMVVTAVVDNRLPNTRKISTQAQNNSKLYRYFKKVVIIQN